MVECESTYNDLKNVTTEVLIDTWWTVNTDTCDQKPSSEAVLIDTWWNVNIAYLKVFTILSTF